MGYELDCKRKVKCPCGNGYILNEMYSNDWMQTKEKIYILCDICSAKYDIQSLYYRRSGETRSNYYLVPKGESLYTNCSYNILETPFEEQLCISWSLQDLKSAYNVL